MITTRKELNEYINRDMPFFHALSVKDQRMNRLTKDPLWQIVKFMKLLRFEEYYQNHGGGKTGKLLSLWYRTRKNRLGNVLGFKIPANTLGPGAMIYHQGTVIINESARIGSDAIFHGNNCIGNNGKDDRNPVIGDRLDLGFGALVIGSVILGNDVKIGANAVVVSSVSEDGVTLTGVPAKRLK